MRLQLAAVAVVLTALTACQSRRQSLEAQLRETESWFRADRDDRVLPLSDDGIRKAAALPDLRLEWRFRLLKAEILMNHRRVPEGLTVLETEPPPQKQWADVRGWVYLLRGVAAYRAPDYTAAQSFYDQASQLAQECGSASLAAEVELRRGALLTKQARFDESEKVLRAVVESGERLHDPYLEARACLNLGIAMHAASRYDASIALQERAAALFEKFGAADSIALAAGNAGTSYLRLGDYEGARPRFEQAYQAAVRTGNPVQHMWLGNLGNVAFESGNFAEAAPLFKKALDLAVKAKDRNGIEIWAANLADTLTSLGDLEQAERYNSQALELARNMPGAEPYCFYNAGRIAAGRGNLDDAERDFKDALRLQPEDPTILMDVRRELADLYVRSGKVKQAEAEFQETIAEVDRLSRGLVKDDYKLTYLDSVIRFHGAYIDFLMSRGKLTRALEIAESARTKVLNQRSGNSSAARLHTAAEFQQLAARSRAVLVEYWLGKTQSYGWTITARGIRSFTMPAAAQVRPVLDQFQAAVLSRDDAGAEAGKQLAEWLLAPVRKEAGAAARCLLVPDKALHGVNFECLPARGTAKYWIEEATVSIAPSLSYVLDRKTQSRGAGRRALLLIGDAEQVLPQYPKLDYAGREISSISSLLNSYPQKVLRGAEARPSAYAAAHPETFSLIHFTAHAEANPLQPLKSAVILSGPGSECRLAASDVAGIPIGADLVSISACRSVGAKTYAGEGPVGFAWAFLKAGAKNVIAGLWDVNDRSTAALMGGLYRRLALGEPVAEALRGAKLDIYHQGGLYARPYYWAPFELYTAEAE